MTVRTWTPEQGCQDWTARTELPGQDCQDKTARKDNQNGQTERERERGQAERDTQKWTGRTGLPGGQPGQERRYSQERRARKGMLDQDIKYWKTGMEQVEPGGRGVAGAGLRISNGQLTLSMGPVRMEARDYVQRANIPSRRVVLL
jgi:hypothetical protein